MLNATTELSRTYLDDWRADQLSSVAYHPRKSEAHPAKVEAIILARKEKQGHYLPHLQLPSHTNRTLPGIVIKMHV